MGLLIDLRGGRQAHRFWKRKLEIVSKVTDPLSRATWPASPSSSSSQAVAEKRFEENAVKHRQPHLFGSGVSADPPENQTTSSIIQHQQDLEKERLKEKQRRYKQHLDAQVKSVLDRKLLEKKTEGAGYDGGLFRRLGEHVVHGRNLSQADLHRKMFEDLSEQIKLKEERIIAEYEAGQKKDAKAESESFWRPSQDGYKDDENEDPPRRFNIRSLLLKPPKDQILTNVGHPPWAIDSVVTNRPLNNMENSRTSKGLLHAPITDRSHRASRHLFSESSERLDKILLDFLDEPIKL